MNLMHTLGTPIGPIRGRRGAPRGRTLRARRGTVTKKGKEEWRGIRGTETTKDTVMNRGRRRASTRKGTVITIGRRGTVTKGGHQLLQQRREKQEGGVRGRH